MTKAKNPRKPLPFNAVRYLTDDDAAITEYLNAVLEANDPDLLLLALGDIARAEWLKSPRRPVSVVKVSTKRSRLAPSRVSI